MDTGAFNGVGTDFAGAGFSGGGVKAILEPGRPRCLALGVLGMGFAWPDGGKAAPKFAADRRKSVEGRERRWVRFVFADQAIDTPAVPTLS